MGSADAGMITDAMSRFVIAPLYRSEAHFHAR